MWYNISVYYIYNEAKKASDNVEKIFEAYIVLHLFSSYYLRLFLYRDIQMKNIKKGGNANEK